MNVKFTPSEEEEIKNHNTGVTILLIGIGCLFMGAAAPSFGIIGSLVMVVGIFMSLGFRSKENITRQKEHAQQMANLMVQQVQAGVKIDVDKYTSKPKTSSGTKDIVKGAVVGGILGGDAGAVVGAVVAKNKLDKEKNK